MADMDTRGQARMHAKAAHESLGDLDKGYPANHFAFQEILPALANLSA